MHEQRLDAFLSAPIKLALKISAKRDATRGQPRRRPIGNGRSSSSATSSSSASSSLLLCGLLLAGQQLAIELAGCQQLVNLRHADERRHNEAPSEFAANALNERAWQLRNHAHYMSALPAVHFSYQEGRQWGARALPDAGPQAEERDKFAAQIDKRSSAALVAASAQQQQQATGFRPPRSAHNPPLVSSSTSATISGQRHYNHHHHHHHHNHLSRRMMASASWLPARTSQQQQQQQPMEEPPREGDDLAAAAAEQNWRHQRNGPEQEAELLRQKQHIQYHDQWPSMAGKCHKRTLNFCASVLPFNTTTFPNIIGDTNRFEVKRSLPFFGFLAKSSCNKRLDELLCLLLEPPCSPASGIAVPPCKKFCRLALEGCNEYIPATLALSSVFDCRQYPDSSDPSVCINLAQGTKCAEDEFKCPDKTCIPRNWLCDGVRDCLFAADEANCTTASATPALSVCSTEEFKCDGKCVPKAWKCDGERDCLDGSDEESCESRPRCAPDRFKCADGNGCIPRPWVCDGKAECRDGSDELNCEQRDCSDNDFKCGNGVCIPKLWRCDRHPDCKDASDEQFCSYATSTTNATSSEQPPTSSQFNSTGTPTSTTRQPSDELQQVNASYVVVAAPSEQLVVIAADSPASSANSSAGPAQSFEAQVGVDVARIIGHESASASTAAGGAEQPAAAANTADGLALRDLKKFDYEMLHNVVQTSEAQASSEQAGRASGSTPQQQHQHRAATPAGPVRADEQSAEQARVPIYRSLFKSLKNQQGQQQQQFARHGQQAAQQPQHQQQARLVARRRRDRIQQARLATGASPPVWAAEQQPQSRPPQQPIEGLAQDQARNTAGTVASYLSLLNSRYNLRLARPAAVS